MSPFGCCSGFSLPLPLAHISSACVANHRAVSEILGENKQGTQMDSQCVGLVFGPGINKEKSCPSKASIPE